MISNPCCSLVHDEVVLCGFSPAPRMFMNFESRSNQNGAPSEIAKAVIASPKSFMTQCHRPAQDDGLTRSLDFQPTGSGLIVASRVLSLSAKAASNL